MSKVGSCLAPCSWTRRAGLTGRFVHVANCHHAPDPALGGDPERLFHHVRAVSLESPNVGPQAESLRREQEALNQAAVIKGFEVACLRITWCHYDKGQRRTRRGPNAALRKLLFHDRVPNDDQLGRLLV